MKAGPKPEPRIKMLKLDILIAFGLLVLVIIFSVWYSHHKTTPNNASSAPAGWTHYASSKYGFQFDYPGSWGKPQISTTSGKTGSHYQITFAADPKSTGFNKNLNIIIGMDSANYASSNCSSNCDPLTSKTIQSNLKIGAKSLIRQDNSSYAFLATIQSAQVSTLTQAQIVDLPSLKVSAAVGLYTLTGGIDCPSGKFAPDSKTNCINQASYNTLNSVLKDIKAF